MSTIGKCSVCGKKGPLGLDDRCFPCLDQDETVPYCDSCLDELSKEEIEAGEITCYPCQKGNR
jgi:hypothetical protein